MGVRVDLLSNATATGATQLWPGGCGTFLAAGTFSGSTVQLEILGPDGATWIAVGTNTTLTAAGGGNFLLPESRIRAAVSGGPPTAMYAVAVETNL